jgi:hypothetical protein
MKKYLFSLPIFLTLITAGNAYAVCPVCTVAVVGGVGLSRWLNIDDTITGLWIGGLSVSLIVWTINWLEKKNIKFMFRKLLVTVVYYGFLVVPLYTTGIMGHELNKLWGIDKLALGITIGSILFFAGNIYYEYLKKNNDGKAYFPFQKIVMPIAPLIVLSIVFYFLTK